MLALFPNEPNFVSANWVPLDRDPSVWEAHITDLARKLVSDGGVDISIIWNMKDESKGYGIGSILIVSRTNKQKFIIPIVIKDFKLAPLDTLITDQHAMRVSQDNIQDMLFSGDLGIGTADRKDNRSNMTDGNDLQMPIQTDYMGYTMYAEKDAGVNLLHAWVRQEYDYFKESMPEAIISTIKDMPFDKKAMARHKNALKDFSILNKYAGEKSVFIEYLDTAEVREDADPSFKKVNVVKKIGPDAYAMLGSSLENLEPFLDVTSGSNLRIKLVGDLGNEPLVDTIIDAAEEAGERGAIIPHGVEQNNATIYSDLPEGKGDTYGVYDAFTPQGRKDRGILFEKAYNFKLEERKVKTFVTAMGGGEQSDSFKGLNTNIAPSYYNQDIVKVFDQPRAGDWGYLLYGKGIIGPMFCMSASGIASLDDPSYMREVGDFIMSDPGGKVVKVTYSDYLRAAEYKPADEYSRMDSLKIAKKFKWMVIPEEIQYTATQLAKQGSILFDNGSYHFRGMDTVLSNDLDEAMAKAALAINGYSIRQIYSMLEEAEKSGACKVNSPLPKPKKLQKKASVMPFDLSKYDFTKLAGVFDNLDTVDKILGLNFINDANISRFLTALPLYINTREELVRLLIVARIGLTEVNETAILQALDALDDVIDGLNRLKTQQNE